ncbi:hypothetical protein NXZ90_13765, partial [Escherichia coli]|nr:hypothetical protein [Escherichia coli]
FECSEHTAHYKTMMGEFYKPLNASLHLQDEFDIDDSANDDSASSKIEIKDGINTSLHSNTYL